MFLVMIFGFIFGAASVIYAIGQGMKHGISTKLIVAAAIGLLFLLFSIYLALPR